MSGIEDFKFLLSGIIDTSHYEDIEHLLLRNVCSKATYFTTEEDCENFANGLTKQGLIVLMSDYISTFEELVDEYSIGNTNATYYIESDRISNACIPLLLVVDIEMNNILRRLFRQIKDDFIEGVSKKYKTVANLCLGLLIGYLILITLIIFGLWQPLLFYLRRIDEKSNKMLAVLPLGIILKMNHIYSFLEKRTLNMQGLN